MPLRDLLPKKSIGTQKNHYDFLMSKISNYSSDMTNAAGMNISDDFFQHLFDSQNNLYDLAIKAGIKAANTNDILAFMAISDYNKSPSSDKIHFILNESLMADDNQTAETYLSDFAEPVFALNIVSDAVKAGTEEVLKEYSNYLNQVRNPFSAPASGRRRNAIIATKQTSLVLPPLSIFRKIETHLRKELRSNSTFIVNLMNGIKNGNITLGIMETEFYEKIIALVKKTNTNHGFGIKI